MALVDRLSAVIFDVGNVLYRWDIRALYTKMIDDAARLDWFCTEVVTPEWHFQHDAGRPFAETSAELIARYPAERALIEAYGPRWLETIPGEVEGMIPLVEELEARSIPLFAITNFSAEFWPGFAAERPIFSRFRDIVVSGEERMLKPDPAIYDLAVARFGFPAESMLFIDDREENVAAAEARGLLGHQFQGAAGVRAALFE